MSRSRSTSFGKSGTAADAACAVKLYVAEPAAAYRFRPPVVVDCSLLAAMLFHEPDGAAAERKVAGRSLHAPALLDYEVASVAIKKSRAGRAEVAGDAMLRYARAAIELHNVDPSALVSLAQRYQLSAYDAAYLWLAAELKAPLATFDRRLGEAAQRHLSALE